MDIKGYSERGMVNALFYEMTYVENFAKLLDEFISLIKFPKYFQGFKVSAGDIYLEPSFSDFGQADAVILVDNLYKKQALYLYKELYPEMVLQYQ